MVIPPPHMPIPFDRERPITACYGENRMFYGVSYYPAIIHPLEQSVALRGDEFLKKYSSSDNYLCRLIAKH